MTTLRPGLWLSIFGCGAFGGSAPTLLELAGIARGGALPGLGFYIAMGIFALLGGGIALIYREQVYHKAFFLGVGAPALIVATGVAADQQGSNGPIPLPLLTSAVYAQEPTAQPSTQAHPQMIDRPTVQPVPQRQSGALLLSQDSGRRLEVALPSGVPYFTVEFFKAAQTPRSPTGEPNARNLLGDYHGKGGKVVLSIPVGANQVTVNLPYVGAKTVKLPAQGNKLKLTATVEGSFWSDFYQALGMKNRARTARDYKVTIAPIRE